MSSPLGRRIALVAIWLAGSVLAVSVAIAAIGMAGARVTSQATMVRASDRTLATILDPVVIEAPTVPPAPGDTVPAPGATTSTVSSHPLSGEHATGRLPASPTSTASAGEPQPKDQTSEAPGTTSPAPTTPPASPSSTKTATVVGGTVKVQCINSSLSLVSAVPAGGFSVEVGNQGPVQVEVQFHTSTHESQVSARCRSGVITFTNEESAGGA